MKISFLKMRSALISALLFTILFSSCKKDEDDTPTNQENQTAALLNGVWYSQDNNAYQTLSFDKNRLSGKDFFIDGMETGSADFIYNFVSDNEIEIEFNRMLGDYEQYNGFTPQSRISLKIGATPDSLFITYNGEVSKYARLAAGKALTQDALLGSWARSGGGERKILTFRRTSSKSGYGSDIFTTQADSVAADFNWDVNGDLVYISFANLHLFGNYSNYHLNDDLIMGRTEILSPTEMAFKDGDSTFIYTKMPASTVVGIDDLLGHWKSTSGTATEVIAFKVINEGGTGSMTHSFLDGPSFGSADWMRWTVSGNLLCIETQIVEGDYEAYTGLGNNSSLVVDVQQSGDQLNITSPGGLITFTKMADSDVYTEDDLLGLWERTDGTLSDTLSISENGSNTNSFSDGPQSGSAKFYMWFNGDMLWMQFYDFTGDYGSYNGLSENDRVIGLISVTSSTFTFNVDGVDYTYTKL
jgi:hypothetical protein